jgi:catalase
MPNGDIESEPAAGKSLFGSSTTKPPFTSFLIIAIVIGVVAAAFAYIAGWLTPDRLTPDKLVDAFHPSGNEPLGHRRNHAKGICFTGNFEANGNGSALSRATVFAKGNYAALGRFNLGTPDPNAADSTVRVRGLGLQITTPDGREWRTAMIDAPVFAVSTPQAFYELLKASTSKEPTAMPTFIAAHPEFAAFGAWAKSAPWMSSYAEVNFNALNSFLFVDEAGAEHAVRWSLLAATPPEPITPDELAKRGPDYLAKDITERVQAGPVRWTMMVTVADAGDPTADPSKAWPEGRKKVDVGTLTVTQIEPEADGPCRDINFDPTVLPPGITTSDDPFPAARSSAYAKSFDRRSAEAEYYPAPKGGAKP